MQEHMEPAQYGTRCCTQTNAIEDWLQLIILFHPAYYRCALANSQPLRVAEYPCFREEMPVPHLVHLISVQTNVF